MLLKYFKRDAFTLYLLGILIGTIFLNQKARIKTARDEQNLLIREIEERRQAEESLRETDALLSEAQRIARIGN